MAQIGSIDKINVKYSDMDNEKKTCAINLIIDTIKKFTVERDIACMVKKYFDHKYGPSWHCIVGQKFGSFVTHETRNFIYFTVPLIKDNVMSTISILLFKSG